MRKTNKEWLEELPDGYKQLAFSNELMNLNLLSRYMYEAITASMSWVSTNEGQDFWENLYDHYYRKVNGRPDRPLPDLPNLYHKMPWKQKDLIIKSFIELVEGKVHPRQFKEFVQNRWEQSQL